MATMSLARKGAIIVGAALALATLTQSAKRYWRGGCWGCGAFAAGAIAGRGGARPYYPRSTMPRLVSCAAAARRRGSGSCLRISGLPGPSSYPYYCR